MLFIVLLVHEELFVDAPALEWVAKFHFIQKLSILLAPNLKQIPEEIIFVAVQIDTSLQVVLFHENLRVLDLEQNGADVVLRALDEVDHLVELVQRDRFCCLLQVLF